MLRFKAGGLAVSVDFSFFLTAAVALLIADELTVYAGFIACVAHEAGHLAAMLLCGAQPDSLRLYGGGICIASEDISSLSLGKKVSVYLSGVAVNLALCVALWNAMPLFAAVNLVLGIFNLLPFTCFDGGATLDIIAQSVMTPKSYRSFKKAARFGDCLITVLLLCANILAGAGGIMMTAVLVYTIILQLYRDEADSP